MGLLDRLRGKDSSPPPASAAADLPSEALQSPAQQPATEILDVPSLGSSPDQGPPGSSGRFYNPYEGLNTAVDGRSLRPGYKLPTQPEFLFSEEATVHRRSWSENLTYYTGTGYVTGAIIGGEPQMPSILLEQALQQERSFDLLEGCDHVQWQVQLGQQQPDC
ncbi:hypothetical protein WJX73_007910 [Symbiochloris irregularis]|uniref:Uncharacterized protein n=1 Tax=Symbiochloris irregularis TaxID=706552 RepID=A0AAW1P8F4_9CHLO